jgi:hypothetical protein
MNMPASGRIGRSPAAVEPIGNERGPGNILPAHRRRVGRSCVKAKAVMSEMKGHRQGKQV